MHLCISCSIVFIIRHSKKRENISLILSLSHTFLLWMLHLNYIYLRKQGPFSPKSDKIFYLQNANLTWNPLFMINFSLLFSLLVLVCWGYKVLCSALSVMNWSPEGISGDEKRKVLFQKFFHWKYFNSKCNCIQIELVE